MPKKKTNTGPPNNQRKSDSGLDSPSKQDTQNPEHDRPEKLPEDPAFADSGAQKQRSQTSSPIAGTTSETKKKEDNSFMRFLKKIAFSVWAVVMAIGMIIAFIISLFLV